MENLHTTHLSSGGNFIDAQSHLPKRKKKILLIASLVFLLLALVFLGFAWLYTGNLTQTKVKTFTRLNLPAAAVNYVPISANDVFDRYNTLKTFSANSKQIFNPSQAKDQVMAKAVESKLLGILAESRSVTVNGKEIEEQYSQIVKQLAGGDEAQFEKALGDYYGLNTKNFKNQVLQDSVLKSKLQQWFFSQRELNLSAYRNADKIQTEAVRGADFGELAKKYSDDKQSATFSGDSGYLSVTDLLPEVQSQLKDAQKGELRLIAGRDGLHVVKVLDRDDKGENNTARIRVLQIFLEGSSFDSWYTEQTKHFKTTNFFRKLKFN